MSQVGSRESETFKIMERRLLRAIMNPAMLAVWITGPVIAYGYGDILSIWLHVKLVLVVILTLFHLYLTRLVAIFGADANQRSTGFYRILNEVPTVLMILIVVLVVVRPV
jgi:putative membrane protein